MRGSFPKIRKNKKSPEYKRSNTNELDRIFSLSPYLYFRSTLDGRLIRLNPSWKQTLGYPAENLEGRAFFDFVHPDDVQSTRRSMKFFSEGKNVIDLTHRCRCHDGTYKWIEWHFTHYQDTLIYAVGHDVTERKLVELQLNRSLRETKVRFDLSQSLVGSETEEGVLDVLIQHAGLYAKAFVVIFTFDNKGDELSAIVRRQNPFKSGLKATAPLGTCFPASRFTLFSRLSAENTFVSDDIRIDDRVEPAGRDILIRTGAISFAMFPLTEGHDFIGVILSMSHSASYFDEEKQCLYQTLAEQGSVALRASRLREAIRDSQQRYQGLVETLSDWIWEVDSNGVYTYASPKVKDLLGYAPEEVLGKTLFDFIVPEDVDRLSAEFYTMLSSRKPLVAIENSNRHKSGRTVVFETSGMPFFDAAGVFMGYRGVDRDVTDRVKVEQELRLTKYCVDKAPFAFSTISSDGYIQTVNEAMCNFTGYTPEDLCSLLIFDIAPSFTTIQFKKYLQILSVSSSELFETVFRRKDGSEFPVEIMLSKLSYKGKDLLFSFAKDISERISAEISEKNLREQLFQTQKMETVGLLAGGVAHDFNNLLTPILGYSELMIREFFNGVADFSKIEQIYRSATLAKELTRKLLTLCRKQMLELQIIDVSDLVNSFIPMLRRTLRENIEIKLTVYPSVSSINADRGQIEQALLNLAINAQDAMPEGGFLTIEAKDVDLDESYTSVHPGVMPGRYLMLSVRDTGIGIDEDIQSHIFDPFFTTKESGKGTGLGLATVYGIVKQHGGLISVHSDKGHGSSFEIYFPTVRKDRVYSGDLAHRQKGIEYGEESVLVVEDNESVRTLVSDMLEVLGYTVLTAESVEQCIDIARNRAEVIDLLLTDVIMPGRNGKELYEIVKRDRPEIKVLFMTGYDDNVIGRQGIVDQGVNLLQKPFTIANLSQKIRKALE
jgi:two-component system cell cycle sensor histidine kinase/response regulator CckA